MCCRPQHVSSKLASVFLLLRENPMSVAIIHELLIGFKSSIKNIAGVSVHKAENNVYNDVLLLAVDLTGAKKSIFDI